MLKNLMYVTVSVSDLDRALTFYTDQLGLQSTRFTHTTQVENSDFTMSQASL